MIIDCIREVCLAYPLDHFFTLELSKPNWPIDEELLRKENLEHYFVPTANKTNEGRVTVPEFFTVFKTLAREDKICIASETSLFVETSVQLIFESQCSAISDDHLKLYTFIFVLSSTEGQPLEKKLVLFGLRHRHTWELQPRSIVFEIAQANRLPSIWG